MTTATMQMTSLRRTIGRPHRDVRPQRPGRGSARSVQPIARSLAGVPAPEVRSRRLRDGGNGSDARALPYAATAAPIPTRSGWRLTDRGIVLVLVAGAVLLAAALTAIAATAVTVTSDHYQPSGSALAQR